MKGKFEVVLYNDQLLTDENRIIEFLKKEPICADNVKVNINNQKINFESGCLFHPSEIGELLLDNKIVFTSLVRK